MRGLFLGFTLLVAAPSLANPADDAPSLRRHAVFFSPLGGLFLVVAPADAFVFSAGMTTPVRDWMDLTFEATVGAQTSCPVVFDAPSFCAGMKVVGATVSAPFHTSAAGTSRGFFVAPKVTTAVSNGDAFRKGASLGNTTGFSVTAGFDIGYRLNLDVGYVAFVTGAGFGYGINVPTAFGEERPGALHVSALGEYPASFAPPVGNGPAFDVNLNLVQLGLWF